MSERASAITGCVIILLTAPLFLLVATHVSGLLVVALGIVGYVVLGTGLYLARRWLGIVRRRDKPGPQETGCLPMAVTLVAIVTGGIILYYVVFYGAAANLGGWNV